MKNTAQKTNNFFKIVVTLSFLIASWPVKELVATNAIETPIDANISDITIETNSAAQVATDSNIKLTIEQEVDVNLRSIKTPAKRAQRAWTFLIYGAADNNLRDYISRNIKQASIIGSNQYVNILFHVDTRPMGNKKVTRRYLIEKNNPVQINIPNEKTPMDSGDAQTLISACRWAIQDYPADNYALIFWDHGTGIIDPYGKRHFNTNALFHFNAVQNAWELDRSIDFIDLIEALADKGICFDDSTGNYLTNQKLEAALQEVTTRYLGGKKFAIIAFDACLMSMLEIAEITKRYADIQISSQEVEPELAGAMIKCLAFLLATNLQSLK